MIRSVLTLVQNLSINVKVILGIILFTLTIVGIERYQISGNIINQFYEAKKSKNLLLVNTVSPILALNMSLGLDQANIEYLDHIRKENTYITCLELKDSTNKVIYGRGNEELTPIHKNENAYIDFYDKIIIDPLSKNKIGSLHLHFSDNDFKQIKSSNLFLTLRLLFITLVLLTVFIVMIRKELLPLKILSNSLIAYDPKLNNLSLIKSDRYDDIGVIQNTIISMVDKINTHTRILKKVNISLEDKIKKRTYELAELNNSLEYRVEQEVQKNKQHQKVMIQQSRHAQMGEVISMIAHQWRQPLNNLSLIIQDAVFQYKVDKLDKNVIATLSKESSKQIRQMSNTIKDFRTFFQPDNVSVEYDINRSIIDAVSIVRPILDAQKVSLDIQSEDGIYIVGFPTELGQGIVNIIMNAKDALMEKNIENKSIKLSLSLVENNAIIIVKDNGQGIPLEIIDKVFDPYFSTKASSSGTGLGLYMTKIIVEEHMNGKLNISNSDDGVIVRIVIPMADV